MKNEAMKKINSMGKVGKVLSTICLVCTIIGLVFTLLFGIACVAVPDFFSLNTNTSVEILIDAGKLGKTIPEDVQREIENQVGSDSVSFDVNGSKYDEVSVTVTDTQMDFVTSPISAGVSIHKIGLVVLSASLAIIGAIIVLVFARKLCKDFEVCETPFSSEVIDDMKKLAYSLIPWACLSMLASAFSSSLFTNDFQFNINIGMIVTILIVFGLTSVFKYGAILQQESDETL